MFHQIITSAERISEKTSSMHYAWINIDFINVKGISNLSIIDGSDIKALIWDGRILTFTFVSNFIESNLELQ